MMQNESHFVLVQSHKLQALLNPVISKLEELESKLLRRQSVSKKYYRNKDLKEIFGLSPNTIIKYRENGSIPSTMLGDVHLYPINQINELLNNNSNY